MKITIEIDEAVLNKAKSTCLGVNTSLDKFVEGSLITQMLLMLKYSPDETAEILGLGDDYNSWKDNESKNKNY